MSLFKAGFEEPDVNFPDKVIEEAIKDFEKATHGLATLSIFEIDRIMRISSHLGSTFQFEILLLSQYLQGYSFEVMRFGYDVSIYPVVIILESEIGEELGVRNLPYQDNKLPCPDEENLLNLIDNIVSTSKFKKTVGGLMKIARSKMESS
jgi:hypothetical protein